MAKRFYTKTLAKLYAEQGYYEDAATGFKELLETNPECKECLAELAKIEPSMKKITGNDDLVALFSEWVTLIKEANEARA